MMTVTSKRLPLAGDLDCRAAWMGRAGYSPAFGQPCHQVFDFVPCCSFSQFAARGMSPRHQFVGFPSRADHPVAAPALVETLRFKRQNIRTDSERTNSAGVLGALR